MANAWALSALWVGLALAATLLAIWFRVATALSEIIVGTIAQLVIGAFLGTGGLLGSTQWITYLAGTGAIVLTFLAGAELEPTIFKTKWREALLVGMAGFFGPFLGCTLVGHLVLGWSMRSSWLCGVALSTTSVAVVYAVMLELGFNVTDFGKSILAACFINDLGTVIALGLIFSPFTVKTLIFVGTCAVLFVFLPALTRWFFKKYGGRVSELETKYILFLLFGLGGLAAWAGSEAVLPAYMIGSVLAGTVGKDHALVHRLRTLTFGLLTPFYFIRAGHFADSVPGKNGHEDRVRLSGRARTQSQRKRRHLLHADDVHGVNLRDDRCTLWPQSPDHLPGPIFLSSGHCDRQRRGAHADRQYMVSAQAPAAPQASQRETAAACTKPRSNNERSLAQTSNQRPQT